MLKLQLTEEVACSCRALSHFVRTLQFAPDTEEGREMILRDLCWRAAELDVLERAVVLAETFHSILPEAVRTSFNRSELKLSEFEQLRREKKQKRNVGIVTVIGKELRAVLTALGRSAEAEPDERSGEFSYWLADIDKVRASSITVVITMVGEARNVPCAIAVEHLLNDYDLDLILLVGIAAGPRSKVKLGDVVFADQVYDYEEYRLEVSSFLRLPRMRPRPKIVSTSKAVKVALERLNKTQCQSFLSTALERVGQELLPSDYFKLPRPNIHDGTIAAGEKLIADGSLEKMRKRVDERIRAGDMEDSGFAQVADIKKLPWCIFRGISDYGDPRKENGWQFVAALGAACSAISFLHSAWSPPKAGR